MPRHLLLGYTAWLAATAALGYATINLNAVVSPQLRVGAFLLSLVEGVVSWAVLVFAVIWVKRLPLAHLTWEWPRWPHQNAFHGVQFVGMSLGLVGLWSTAFGAWLPVSIYLLGFSLTMLLGTWLAGTIFRRVRGP